MGDQLEIEFGDPTAGIARTGAIDLDLARQTRKRELARLDRRDQCLGVASRS